MTKRFVSVPSDRFLACLRAIGEAVVAKGGIYTEGVHGREIYVDIKPPKTVVFVRLYTSIAEGSEEVRDCGDDAVRYFIAHRNAATGKMWPLGPSTKVLRTAPRAHVDRAGFFLERLKDAIRVAYTKAIHAPVCVRCGQAMKLRMSKGGSFYGCTDYPVCKSTKMIAVEPVDAGVCPCGKPQVLRIGSKGEFFGCSDFPKCRISSPSPRLLDETRGSRA